MRVFILSSDKTIQALPNCLYLLEKFWPNHPQIVVGGYTKPDFDLRGAEFFSIGKFEDYPAEKWSDGVIKFLEAYNDRYIIVWMDDYWLIRDVDEIGVEALGNFMKSNTNIARCDLTLDRLGAGGARVIRMVKHLDVITNEPLAQYAMSFQAGIWSREKLLRYLIPGETAWQSEIIGTTRINTAREMIVGTKQGPVKYLIAIQQGKYTLDGGYQGPDCALPEYLKLELELYGD